MDIDVAAVRRKDTLMMGQHAVNHGCIGLRSSHEEINSGIRGSASLLHKFLCSCCIVITAIADSLFRICLHQALHHLRMCSRHIIRIEVNHVSYMLKQTNISNKISNFAALIEQA